MRRTRAPTLCENQSTFRVGAFQPIDQALQRTPAMRSRQASYSGSRMLSAANRNAPEPQAGSRIVTFSMACQNARSRFGSFAVFDHVLRELADVEVERDQFVDVADFAVCEFLPNLLIALPASDDFAPDFSRQGKFSEARLCSSPAAFGNVFDSGFDLFRQRNLDTFVERLRRCSGRDRLSVNPRWSGRLDFRKRFCISDGRHRKGMARLCSC